MNKFIYHPPVVKKNARWRKKGGGGWGGGGVKFMEFFEKRGGQVFTKCLRKLSDFFCCPTPPLSPVEGVLPYILWRVVPHERVCFFHCSKSIPPTSGNLWRMAYSYLRNECDPARIARCGPDRYCNRIVAHHFMRSGRDRNRCGWDRFCVRTYSDAGGIALPMRLGSILCSHI